MRAARVSLSRSCNQACAFCEVADRLDQRALAAGEVRAAIDAAKASGADTVVLTGGEPTLSAHLVKALGYAKGLGLRTAMSTNGRLLADPARLGRVVAAGLDAVHVGLHGASATPHTALVGGDPLAFDQTVAGLEACAAVFDTTLRTVLTGRNVDELPALIDLAARLRVRFDLRRVEARGRARGADLDLPPHHALDAWKAARRRCEGLGVPFTWAGFDGLGLLDGPAEGPPAALDTDARVALTAGLVDRALLAGLALPDDEGLAWLAGHLRVPVAQVGHAAAARRLPILDLDPALGGRGRASPAALGPATPLPSTRPAGAIVVVVDDTADALLARSTLPGLHHELLARGGRSTLRTLFRAPYAADTIPPLPAPGALGRLAGLLRSDDRPLHPDEPSVDLAAAEARWRERLDLSGADVIVAPSARTAARLRGHPSLRPGARFVVLDHGLLDGFDGLGDDDVLRSPFPAAFRSYVLAGVPLRQLAWRPAPTHLSHLPVVDPGASRTVVLAGGDAVDVELVRAAWPADAGLRLLRLDVDLPGLGEPVPADPAARLAALGSARLVWLPVRPTLAPAVARAASLALAAGRPLVATETPLVADHARPADARLLRADADAHRAALRLDDDAVRALAPTPARRHVASTALLADELLRGAPPVRVVGPYAPAGPWWCW